jgi:Zn finger protein HypA/HybF involved in hydrogenase expression
LPPPATERLDVIINCPHCYEPSKPFILRRTYGGLTLDAFELECPKCEHHFKISASKIANIRSDSLI